MVSVQNVFILSIFWLILQIKVEFFKFPIIDNAMILRWLANICDHRKDFSFTKLSKINLNHGTSGYHGISYIKEEKRKLVNVSTNLC